MAEPIYLLFGFAIALSAIDRSLGALQMRSFLSRLDHFKADDEREFQMLYMTNREHFNATHGPIFIQIQEGDHTSTEFLQSGLIHDIAVEQQAALISIDLRYFHENLPTQNASTQNLRYLSIDQIVHDIRSLVVAVRPSNATNPVILWGSGLGANVATWTQRRFPQLIAGVWSSSGIYRPVLHTSHPLQHLARQIGATAVDGGECLRRLGDAFAGIEEYIAYGVADLVTFYYELCAVPDYRVDGELSAVYAGVVQLIIDEINQHHLAAVHDLCRTLNAIDEEQVQFAAFVALGDWVQRRSAARGQQCFDVSFSARLRINRAVQWPTVRQNAWSRRRQLVWPHLSRPLLYLHCTQLGRTLTTVNLPANSSFGHQIGQDLFHDHCGVLADSVGRFDYLRLAGEIEALATRMAGDVAEVVYTNGELNAWYPYGEIEAGRVAGVVINIPGYGKSADLYSINSTDSRELADAKQQITRLITQWIVAK